MLELRRIRHSIAVSIKKQMVSRKAAKTAKNESNLIALFFALFASLRGTSSRREVR
jgi:hypothetical protein